MKTIKLSQRLSYLILPAIVIVALLASFCSPMVAPVSVAAGEPTQTAKYLPEDTEFYTTVDLSLGNKQELQQIANIWLSNPEVAEWLQAFEEEAGIDIEDIKEDILSWLGGEAAMAMRNLTAEMPEFIVLIGTIDKDDSYSFFRSRFLPLFFGVTLEELEAADMLPPASLEDFVDEVLGSEDEWLGKYNGIETLGKKNIPWDSYTIDGCWAFCENWLIFSTSIDLFFETLDLYLEGGEFFS